MRYHLWFRGVSKPIETELDKLLEHVSLHVYLAGIGESGDKDSLYVFSENELHLRFCPVHSSVGYDEHADEAFEMRVFNVFDEQGELVATETLTHKRQIEEGEIGGDYA